MNIFFSVVSHGHESLIMRLGFLAKLAQYESVAVIVKTNKACSDSNFKAYCCANDIICLDENYGLGFGANNNFVFGYCLENGMDVEHDLFCVINPDVMIDEFNTQRLLGYVKSKSFDAIAINLYRDISMSVYDNSIRTFPSAYDFVSSFLFKANKTIIDKSVIIDPTVVDWAAGSFILFRSRVYADLSGFDEKYFMYCEDIDICYRLSRLNYFLTFVPWVIGVHLAEHANRSILSMHFYWHLKSICRYLYVRARPKG